ncbi:hypothetical protein [Dactylosporangium sp. CS-033363]|uniref:hypothetical protein n=1 Tax=Dactylosporangium sp. CS-033363 TaxID=3239935 RepID=UPI003D949984
MPEFALIGAQAADPTTVYTTVTACPTCKARPGALCTVDGQVRPAGGLDLRYAVHLERPPVYVPILDTDRGVPTLDGRSPAAVALALQHRVRHGGLGCIVPGCIGDALIAVAVEAPARLARVDRLPGDVIDLCTSHAGDLYGAAADPTGDIAVWLLTDQLDAGAPIDWAAVLGSNVDQAGTVDVGAGA